MQTCNLSTIWKCVHRESGELFCAKIVDRRRFRSQEDELRTLNEIKMLQFIKENVSDLSCLVRLVEVLQDDNHFYIMTELVEEGSLALRLKRHYKGGCDATNVSKNLLSEAQVQRIVHSLLKGLQALHGLGICHGNITPENILLEEDGSRAKLCDFGAAFNIIENCFYKNTPQRLHYKAPELLSGTYLSQNLASDMWSVGVVVYYALCGSLPFRRSASSSTAYPSSKSNKELLQDQIVAGTYDFSGPEWQAVSREAKQFISALLHVDPHVRMNVQEALEHSWMLLPKSNTSRYKIKQGQEKMARKALSGFWFWEGKQWKFLRCFTRLFFRKDG
jgi:serine/threonine protein kinase